MADISSWNLSEINSDLIFMQRECSERGLLHSSAWAAALYNSLEVPDDDDQVFSSFTDIKGRKNVRLYALAKSYFDLREYERAAYFIEDVSHPKIYFLHVYARYLADEKRKIDNSCDTYAASAYKVDNEGLKTLQVELAQKHRAKQLDGFCLYLYGVVLRKLDLMKEAIHVFEESINAEPRNWSAWSELSLIMADREMVSSLSLPKHWMRSFFLAHVYLALQMNDESLKLYQSIRDHGFTDCPYIKSQIALIYHNVRDMDQALVTFNEVEKADPFRLQNMDTYSNLLYVKEMRVELANLAHKCCNIDKYRVETCCVIGNFYSLRGQHEKAIMYFQRVLKLNPHYLSAWTLMGHEFMEIKNTSAAIHAYRQALEVNKRDYRAWYGLGQTYEILKMPFYSTYYYRQAQMLRTKSLQVMEDLLAHLGDNVRPNDSRMIVALGECYEKLERLQEAKKCFWKAHNIGDIEGMALIKLARLYEKLCECDQAAAAYTDYITEATVQRNYNPEHQSHAYKYLANYHLRRGQLDEAYATAQKCAGFPETREEAKAILKQVARLRTIGEGVVGDVDESPTNRPTGDRTPFSRLAPMNLRFTPC